MENEKQCSLCNHPVLNDDIYCSNCGYPENGEEKEQKQFKFSIKLKKDALAEARKKIKHVKILLYVLAGLNIVLGIFWLTNAVTLWEGVGCLIAAVVFLACSFWVNKQPLIGTIAAFIFWLLLQLSVVFEDPLLLIKGIIWKLLIIGLFIKGIASAKDVKELKEKLGPNFND